MKIIFFIIVVFCVTPVFAGEYDCDDDTFLPENADAIMYDSPQDGWSQDSEHAFSSPGEDEETSALPEADPQCTSCEETEP